MITHPILNPDSFVAGHDVMLKLLKQVLHQSVTSETQITTFAMNSFQSFN